MTVLCYALGGYFVFCAVGLFLFGLLEDREWRPQPETVWLHLLCKRCHDPYEFFLEIGPEGSAAWPHLCPACQSLDTLSASQQDHYLCSLEG